MAHTKASHLLDSMVHGLCWDYEEAFGDRPEITKGDFNSLIKRNCYTCGMELNWNGFYLSAQKHGNFLSKNGFDLETCKIIWQNDLFVLNCCHCHSPIPEGVFVSGDWMNQQEYMQDPTPEEVKK